MVGMRSTHGLPAVEAFRQIYLRDHSLVCGSDFGAGSRLKTKKTVATIARHGISSRKDCTFLYELARITQPQTCIELGTSLGIATAYLSKSVPVGKIYTFEGNEELVSRTHAMLGKLDCDNVEIIRGNIDSELPVFLDQIEEVDFALLDANHTFEALTHYFYLLKRKMSPGACMVIDDIRWSKGMHAAWQQIRADGRVSLSMEFLHKGVVIFDLPVSKQHYVLSY